MPLDTRKELRVFWTEGAPWFDFDHYAVSDHLEFLRRTKFTCGMIVFWELDVQYGRFRRVPFED